MFQFRNILSFLKKPWLVMFLFALFLPIFDEFLPREWRFADLMRPIFVFSLLGLGLNIVTGYTGLLNLGAGAFMALGAYAYAIVSCNIFPFQLSFWSALMVAVLVSATAGILLGIPTLRLRGDYIAIVTLGFGEIVQDSLKNLDVITKGTQGINPLPVPTFFGYVFQAAEYRPWYYLFLMILFLLALLSWNLEHSRVGRSWRSLREDELASGCVGIQPVLNKLLAFSTGAAFCGIAGALWACMLGSTGEPGNYDFQVSIIALCIVIVGGIGSIQGVLLGAFLMVGFNSIFLKKLSEYLVATGSFDTTNVFFTPGNWKFFVFGMALILVTRYRPDGLLPKKFRTD